jgi:hypothetical protein
LFTQFVEKAAKAEIAAAFAAFNLFGPESSEEEHTDGSCSEEEHTDGSCSEE